MEAFFLTRYGDADKAFERRPLTLPDPKPGQVLIEVEAFGLNFADVMARRDLYNEAPPLPCVLGYEAAGRVAAIGENCKDVTVGQRVVAFTRFGAYASHVLTDYRAVAPLPEDLDATTATALATQYCTAYYSAAVGMQLHAGEHVLVHAAAGGVGTALVQFAKHKGCTVYGTTGSDEKINYLRSIGVDHPINYRKEKFADAIRRIRGEKGIDAAFDSVGGKTFRESFRLLAPGGRIAGYGAAQRVSRRSIISDLRLMFGFGFYHPVKLLMGSKTISGVNMLRVADDKPDLLQEILQEVMRLHREGVFRPQLGAAFDVTDLAKAHALLESRASTGKIAVRWSSA